MDPTTAQAQTAQAQTAQVHDHLRTIGELLHRPRHIDEATRAALADLVDELDRALKVATISSDEAAQLAASATRLAEALHRAEKRDVLQAARDHFEESIVAAEARAPMLAGLARRVMGALSNMGI